MIEIKHRYTSKVIHSLEGNTLRGADLEEADLRRAYLQGADLEEAYLAGADLERADLERANLREANLRGADLREADLRRAYLQGADLEEAYLAGADLRGANLYRAYLGGADLRGANLYRAYLGGANLGGAKGIISLGPVGKECRIVYATPHRDSIRVKDECFWGTLPEFIEAVEAKYGKDGYRDGYGPVINYLSEWERENCPEAAQEQESGSV